MIQTETAGRRSPFSDRERGLIMSKDVIDAVAGRRSVYAIGRGTGLSDDRVLELIRHALKNAPSAFNSQGARLVVLLGAAHEELWNMTLDVLRGIVPADSFGPTQAKIASFRAGRGTVLFYEDQDTVKKLQEKYPLYKDNFPVWSLESSGIVQYIVWTLLEAEGLGASLQHYNPLIDGRVAGRWDIPAGWKLLGQMPFGSVETVPDAKSTLPLEGRFRVYR